MYAVIESGGHQYRVQPGETVKVEKLAGEVGQPVTLDKVLLVADGESVKVGRPYLEGATVVGTIQRQARHPKVIVFKKKRRKGYHLKKGHRQYFTAVKIEQIQA
jgi:large subunit ribosomal protein L21